MPNYKIPVSLTETGFLFYKGMNQPIKKSYPFNVKVPSFKCKRHIFLNHYIKSHLRAA